MNAYEMIETKPEVMLGKPVIKEAIQAALIYAADMIHNETTIFLKAGAAN